MKLYWKEKYIIDKNVMSLSMFKNVILNEINIEVTVFLMQKELKFTAILTAFDVSIICCSANIQIIFNVCSAGLEKQLVMATKFFLLQCLKSQTSTEQNMFLKASK
jgi:hypothetical protein